MQVTVTGAAELQRLSVRLRAAGDGSLNRRLRHGVTDAVRPLKRQVIAGLPSYMPNRYAGVLGGSLKLRTDAAGDQVKITATAKGRRKQRAVPAINDGILRHPIYGNRKRWAAQRIRRGFFTNPLKSGGPTVQRSIERVMEDVTQNIARG